MFIYARKCIATRWKTGKHHRVIVAFKDGGKGEGTRIGYSAMKIRVRRYSTCTIYVRHKRKNKNPRIVGCVLEADTPAAFCDGKDSSVCEYFQLYVLVVSRCVSVCFACVCVLLAVNSGRWGVMRISCSSVNVASIYVYAFTPYVCIRSFVFLCYEAFSRWMRNV